MAYYIPSQGQSQGFYPAPVVYLAAPAVTYQSMVINSYGPHYARQTSTVLGSIEIVLACISIVAGILALVYYAGLGFIGTGIWCGIIYLLSGSIAVAAGKQATNHLITATAACSVFNILFGITQLTIASIGVPHNDCYNYSCPNHGAIAANSMMIGVGVLMIIFGIWLLVNSGYAIHKGNKTQMVTVPVSYAATQPETVLIQGPGLQPQPPPGYYSQQQYTQQMQYPMILNSQQTMNAGAQQTPPSITKYEEPPPRY